MEKDPVVFAISGVKNSGKTTLITKVIEILTGRGLKVATIKHDGHEFEADVEGTDTYRHLQAGAVGTAVYSSTKFMVVKKQENTLETQLREYFKDADLILLEGFKYNIYPKVEIVRKGNSEKSICPREELRAIVSDFQVENCDGLPILDLNRPEQTADLIYDYWFAATHLSMVVLAGGLSSRMGQDKSDLEYHRKSFLEIQIEKGKQLGIRDILVSGYRGQHCKEKIVKDRYEQKGPLGGLEASFRRCSHSKCLVLSVDCPLVPTEELRALVRKADAGCSKAVILKHGEKEESLIGVYDTDLADGMEREILFEKGSVFAFLRKNGYEVYDSKYADEYFRNINNKTEYEKI